MPSANLDERSNVGPAGCSDRAGSASDEWLEQALAHWMGVDGRARLLVDGGLKVCWTNPAADSLMCGGNALLIRSGHVRTRENRFERQLRGLIDGASSQLSTCCVHDPKAGEHLVLTALRLSAPLDDIVGLTLLRADDRFAFHLVDLRSAFGFTQSEGRVTYRMLCGRTAEGTAQDLGVSLETVRTHIKRAYAKLGVSSREGFFHRLAPFVILLT